MNYETPAKIFLKNLQLQNMNRFQYVNGTQSTFRGAWIKKLLPVY